MKPSILTTEIILDPRRAKANGAYPLKLRITYQRIQKYYKLKLEATDTFWAEVQSGRRTKQHNDMRDAVASIKHKVNQVLRSIEKQGTAFDFLTFERLFFGQELESVRKRENAQDVYYALDTYVKRLEQEGRVSTAMSYNNALQSLKNFSPTLYFKELTPSWLATYERHLLTQGRSVSTVGIYLRSLRIVVNQAVEQGVIGAKEYPFGKNRYQIPVAKNVKKALPITAIRAIRNYPLEAGSSAERGRDLWAFSYFCNGMNLKDIFRLTWRNVDGNMIRFYRNKTRLTTRSQPRRIDVVISEPVQAIITKWGNADKAPDSLIFPLFKPNLSAKEWDLRARDLIKQMNYHVKAIGKALNLDLPVTSYVARHSYATVMKRSGASAEHIQESLGHTTLRTTETYLDSFDDDVKRDLVNALL